ncbi:hypothetical protein AB0I02_12950 [Streptomyces phaeochromogenes]
MVEFLRKALLHELDSYSIDFKPVPRFTQWRKQRDEVLPPEGCGLSA